LFDFINEAAKEAESTEKKEAKTIPEIIL